MRVPLPGRPCRLASAAGPRSRIGGRGFTLIELTLVLVLLALLSGVAVTSLDGLASSRQGVAAARIRTVLVFAQEWAMATGNDTWVAFDIESDRVSGHVEDPATPGRADRLTLTDPLTRGDLVLHLGHDGAGIESAVFGGTAEVRFDASGTPHDEDGIALTADGTVGITGGVAVRVTKGTGLVSID